MRLEGLLKQYKFEENQTKIDEVTAQLKRLEMPRIIEEGNYINGKKEGTWTFRNSTGNYTNGKKDGTWTFLSSDGISEEEVYEDGELKYININD
jgi:antitoxin component YwqK of YwqJK toxin-antitoxin module